MKCFYHNDMDGKCAGAIVYKYFCGDENKFQEESEFICMDYRKSFPFDIIKPNETVVIVDYALENEGDFDKLKNITTNIIWIDHHKTSIEKHKNVDIIGSRQNGVAACVLTWKYFYPNKEVPLIVDMLGSYDIWDFSKYGEDLNYIQSGIRLYSHEPNNKIWDYWLDNKFIEDILLDGKTISDYRKISNENLVKYYSFFSDFEGYKTICCNAVSNNSQLFDSVKEDFDIMAVFSYDGNLWKVSLFTKKDIDVGEIAKKYGGGGHMKAAGFNIAILPFKRKVD